MIGTLILAAVIAGAILYVHKVGLPAIKQEMTQARVEVVAAIGRHASQTSQASIKTTSAVVQAQSVKANPVPLARSESAGPDKQDLSM